jgi:hypothetical protein
VDYGHPPYEFSATEPRFTPLMDRLSCKASLGTVLTSWSAMHGVLHADTAFER